MNHPESSGPPRWQYVILWRYGSLVLAIVGLGMVGFGASGVEDDAVSVALLTLGFASLVAGIVLPRIGGKFSAGSSGVTGDLLAVHELDAPTFVVSGPALAVPGETPPNTTEPIRLGDIWDALEAAGFYVEQSMTGKRLLRGPEGRAIILHGSDIQGFRIASSALIAQVRSWGVNPVPSGRYQPDPDVDPAFAATPYDAVNPPPGA